LITFNVWIQKIGYSRLKSVFRSFFHDLNIFSFSNFQIGNRLCQVFNTNNVLRGNVLMSLTGSLEPGGGGAAKGSGFKSPKLLQGVPPKLSGV